MSLLREEAGMEYLPDKFKRIAQFSPFSFEG